MLLLFNFKVFKLNKNLTITEICDFKIPGGLYNTFYKHWYINNNNELLININSNFNTSDNIIIIGENGIIKKLRIECYYNDVLAVEKYNNEYYMLFKNKIIIIDNEFNIKEYELLHEFKSFTEYYYTKYYHFIFYNNNLFIAYYNEEPLENDNSIITLNLLNINLKDNIFVNKEIKSIETIFSQLQDIVVFNNNIIFCIKDYDNLHKIKPKKIMLFNYNLNTNTLKYKNIKDKLKNVNRIEKLNNKLIIFDNSVKCSDNFIYLYNIENLEFEKHLIINKEIVNGYYDIIFKENILIIRPYISRNIKKDILYILNSNDISEKNIKLGALALKHKFKEILDIDYGYNTDIKEYILEKMNCKVKLNENDNLINYEIIGGYNYNFDKEIEI